MFDIASGVMRPKPPQPIQLIVMIDVSSSMRGNLALLRASAQQLFSRLGDEDVAKVGTFGSDVAISPTFTRDMDALLQALPIEIRENTPTPLWRGIDDAMSAFETSDRRRVVLVLSDGGDSPGFSRRVVSQVHVIERALRENVMLYAIGLRSFGGLAPGMNIQDALAGSLPHPGLGRAATESGGGYFELRPRENLGAVFTKVMDELHGQYLLGFAPPARDGKTHKIEVRLATRGLEARARKNYQAPSSAAR